MTSSSNGVFPARSPRPFTVTWAQVAPAFKAATVFASAKPRSSWQWIESGAIPASGGMNAAHFSGVSTPTVSQKQSRSAPRSTPPEKTYFRNSWSALEASSPESSTMSPRLFAYSTELHAISAT